MNQRRDGDRVGTGTGQGQLHFGLEPLHFFSFFLFCKRRGGQSLLGAWPPSYPHAKGQVCPPLALPGGPSPTSVMPRIIRSFRKMLAKSTKRSTQCLWGQRDVLRGTWPVSPPPSAPWPQHPPDVILVPALRLLNDELRVKEHEAAHDHQPQVEIGLQEGEGMLDRDSPCWCH